MQFQKWRRLGTCNHARRCRLIKQKVQRVTHPFWQKTFWPTTAWDVFTYYFMIPADEYLYKDAYLQSVHDLTSMSLITTQQQWLHYRIMGIIHTYEKNVHLEIFFFYTFFFLILHDTTPVAESQQQGGAIQLAPNNLTSCQGHDFMDHSESKRDDSLVHPRN